MIWRVFLNDVLECTRCKGRMEIVAALTSDRAIERVLGHLGLPLDPPELHPARPPPQTEMSFEDDPSGFQIERFVHSPRSPDRRFYGVTP